MIGNDAAGPGVMVLTMRDLFLEVENSKSEKNYKVSSYDAYKAAISLISIDIYAVSGSLQ